MFARLGKAILDVRVIQNLRAEREAYECILFPYSKAMCANGLIGFRIWRT